MTSTATEIRQTNLKRGKSLILVKLENGWGWQSSQKKREREGSTRDRSVENVSRGGGKENVDVPIHLVKADRTFLYYPVFAYIVRVFNATR